MSPRLFSFLALGLFSVAIFWTTETEAQFRRRFQPNRQNTSKPVNQDSKTQSTGQANLKQTPVPSPVHKKQNYALLIGINKYTTDTETLRRKSSEERGYLVFNSLKYCIADMKGLRDALVNGKYAPKDNIILLTDDNPDEKLRPTHANIVKYLNEINSQTEENDAVLIAFAGHGIALPSTLNNQSGAQSYLCPMDAEISRNTDSGEWETHNSLIPLSSLFSGSETKKGVRKIAILDACRNVGNVGDIQGGGRNGVTFVRGGETQVIDLPNFQEYDLSRFKKLDRLASCAEGQKAHEDPTIGHGVYSNFMIKGLEGEADGDKNGEITVQELTQYVAKETKKHVQNIFQQEQSPTYSANESETFIIAHCSKSSSSRSSPKDDDDRGKRSLSKPPISNPK
jgi:uncharacterized caspase-like protein